MVEVKTVSTTKDTACVELIGEVDIYCADDVRSKLMNIASDTQQELHVELGNLKYIDSTGLSILIAIHKRMCEKGGKVILHNPSPPVNKLLEITKLNRILLVEDGDCACNEK